MHRPYSEAIVGGPAVSQVLALFTTPVIYIHLDHLCSWGARGSREAFSSAE